MGFIGSHVRYYTTQTLLRVVALAYTLNNIVTYLGGPENVSLFISMKRMLDFFGQVSFTALKCSSNEKYPLETLNVLVKINTCDRIWNMESLAIAQLPEQFEESA